MKFSQHYQWTCGTKCSTSDSTNFQDDSTVILDNRKIRVFPKIEKGKAF